MLLVEVVSLSVEHLVINCAICCRLVVNWLRASVDLQILMFVALS